MSTTPKNGGPAFPLREEFHDHTGMTLRDWFAGQAIQNSYLLYDDAYERTVSDETYAEAACNAYRIADAMIAARGKGGEV